MRFGLVRQVALATGVSLALGACSVFGGTTSSPAPSPATPAASPAPAPSATPQNLQPGWFSGVFGAPLTAPPSAVPPGPRPVSARCPRVDIREGTETVRTFNPGAGEDPQALRWQATIGQTARECRSAPTAAGFIVGISGRVLLGPAGEAGTYELPLRIAFVRGLDKVIESRLVKVPVTVAPNDTQGSFSYVTPEIVVPREETDSLANLQILVGFDPAPPQPERPTRPVRRTRPRPQAQR